MLYFVLNAFDLGCTYTTTQKALQNAPGLTQQGVAGTYTESSCVTACGVSSTCLSCDYNFQNSLCFFGTTLNPATISNSATDHYDFVKTCNGGMLFLKFWYSLHVRMI